MTAPGRTGPAWSGSHRTSARREGQLSQVGRRRFLAALGATALTLPFERSAWAAREVPIIGVIVDSKRRDLSGEARWESFVHDSLAGAGYTVGKNVYLEWRFTEGKFDRVREFANELVRLEVDVILSLQSYPAVGVIRAATQSIPIVMYAYPPNPVNTGLIKSFARPAGNVTGTTWVRSITELTVKQFQILKEAAPQASRVAVLRWIKSPPEDWVKQIGARVNESFGLVVTDFPVGDPAELPTTLDRVLTIGPDVLFTFTDSFLIQYSKLIADFAIEHNLITMGSGSRFVDHGGLLYYGPDVVELMHRTMSYVDRILRGAKPGELPVEEPTKFRFAFNAKTAKALGYSLPPSLQLRVDRVLQ